MSDIKQYSIWLMPAEGSNEYKVLKNKIREFKEKFKNQYDLPDFEPHMTLLPDILDTEDGILEKTEQLAKLLTSFEVELGDFDYTEVFYQCLVVRAVVTPQIIQANKKARDVFSRHKDNLYVPHLSLIYSTEIDQQTKLDLISEMDTQLKGLKFLTDCLHIFTSGTPKVEDWERIAKINLNG